MNLGPLNAFIQTGHCVFTWLSGIIGGILGGWLYDRENTAETQGVVLAHPLDS
jgi:hypothetical protein